MRATRDELPILFGDDPPPFAALTGMGSGR